jgi:hypothetical protein
MRGQWQIGLRVPGHVSPTCEIAMAAETAAGGRVMGYSKRTTAGQAESEMHARVGKSGLTEVISKLGSN